MEPAKRFQTGGSAGGPEIVHEVWAWNLDKEFGELVAAASDGSIVAIDMEFPGFLRQQPRSDVPGAQAARYQALRENVDHLRPIQLGVAVAGQDGVLRGVWSFNLQFNLNVDLHTEKSVAFLRAAGIDFQRLASEGIEATALGLRLAGSRLVDRRHGRTLPRWVTFSGTYDFGYLVKLLTANKPLPYSSNAYDAQLEVFCPNRHELRAEFPHGSLETLSRRHGLQRRGVAHTAGSDALLTLDLFLRVVGLRKDRCLDLPGAKWDAARGMGEVWHANGVNGNNGAKAATGWDANGAWQGNWPYNLAQPVATGWEQTSKQLPMIGWESAPSNWDYTWSWMLPPPMLMAPPFFWMPQPVHKLA